jgi:Integrase core domain/HTH-like domain
MKQLCRILLTDRAHYRAWAKAATNRAPRKAEEQRPTRIIVETHTAYPAYGAERITRELKRQGIEVGRRRAARPMRENGVAGITRRKRRNPTRPNKETATVPYLIRRDFTAPIPGLKLVGDITCLSAGEGWVYVATVLDLCTRELIGHAIAPHMRARLAIDAVETAHCGGLVAGNSIMHTDRGGQYHHVPTATRSATWRSAPAPVEPDHAWTAPPPNPSSPHSKPRSAPAAGPTAPARGATSRTGSPPTTSATRTPLSTTKPPQRHALPGNNASQQRCKRKGCSRPCRLHTAQVIDLDTARIRRRPTLGGITSEYHIAA